MQRNMDLIREFLLRVEALPIGMAEAYMLMVTAPPLLLTGENADEVFYNMQLLADAGFLNLTSSQPALGFGIMDLTWQGHEFLDSVRDPEIWRKAKDGAQKAGGFTLELLRDLAKDLIKTQIEKHTGVEL